MIFTFYSYKGGVGRSMAMAHVAWELASRGLRVLAIDFDLEAPGLERYFRVPVGEVLATPGVIDLIEAFKRSLSGSGGMARDAEFRQLSRFIHRPVADFGHGGRLDLMPAGRRASDDDKRAYALAVRTFDWQDFYFNWEGQAFFEWLRRSLVEGPDALYDVVLADSRTGVTEMGGVCACQLADVVVMLSAPNHQNIEGTRELAADLRSKPVQRLRRNRPPLKLVVVPARVEQRVPDLLHDFEQRFETAFREYRPQTHIDLGLGTNRLALPYVPEFAFDEQVTQQREGASSALDASYKTLADALLVLCDEPASPALRQAVDAAGAALQPSAGAVAVPTAAQRFDPTRRYAGVDAYLSCARAARDVVKGLLDALADSGVSLRCEFGEAEAFGTDRDLPPTTLEQLRHAESLLLFADDKGVRSWQRAEVKVARSLPRAPALVQVLLPGAAADAFELAFGDALRDCPLIDLRGWPEERAALRIVAAALATRPGGGDSHAGDETHVAAPAAAAAEAAPFAGVAPSTEQHAAFFGGRDGERDALLALVLRERRVALHGPSGAGKTSLVLAGLFPALRGHPVLRELRHVDLRQDAEALTAQWQAWAQLPESCLLVLDHADECDDATLDGLAGVWRADGGPRLLLVWRAAPLAQAQAEATLRWPREGQSAAALRGPEHRLHHDCVWGRAAADLLAPAATAPQLALVPLAADALRAAVESALAHAGRRAEAGLVERLFTDAGAAPAAATVQRVMLHLWRHQERGWLTNDAYDHAGGVDGLFTAELDRVAADLGADAQPALAALLLRLVARLSDGTLLRVPFSWARSATQPALDTHGAIAAKTLARQGLLVVQRAGADVTLQLAHGPRDWPALDSLREANKGWVINARLVALAYAAWADGEPDDAADLSLGEGLSAPLLAHLSLGERLYAGQRQARLLRRRRTKRILQAVSAAAVVLVVSGVVVQSRYRQAAQDAAARLAIDAARAQLELGATANTNPTAPVTRSGSGRVRIVAQRSGGDAADAAAVARLLGVLPKETFEVLPTIERRSDKVCGDVRFHHDEDAAPARRVLDLLNAELTRGGDLRQLQLNDRRSVAAAATVATGTLEIWLPPLTDAPARRRDRWGDSRLVPAGCAILGSDVKGREIGRAHV